MTEPALIVALDFPEAPPALALARKLSPELCRLKVGKELFTAAGPALVEQLVSAGFSVFLDLKFHDIPETVAQATRAAARLGVWMVNVHALGGSAMMQAAASALGSAGDAPRLIAVTVLTSHGEADLAPLGLAGPLTEAALRLAGLANESGLHGVVCSAWEAAQMRDRFGAQFLRVTPGVRPADAASNDQRRVATPAQALALGASHLVVGRPITRAQDPLAALRSILTEMKG